MKMHLPTIFLAIAIVALAGSVMYATRYSTERVDRFDVITIDHWTGEAMVCDQNKCRAAQREEPNQVAVVATAPADPMPALINCSASDSKCLIDEMTSWIDWCTRHASDAHCKK